jgi:hypothetical protein
MASVALRPVRTATGCPSSPRRAPARVDHATTPRRGHHPPGMTASSGSPERSTSASRATTCSAIRCLRGEFRDYADRGAQFVAAAGALIRQEARAQPAWHPLLPPDLGTADRTSSPSTDGHIVRDYSRWLATQRSPILTRWASSSRDVEARPVGVGRHADNTPEVWTQCDSVGEPARPGDGVDVKIARREDVLGP